MKYVYTVELLNWINISLLQMFTIFFHGDNT